MELEIATSILCSDPWLDIYFLSKSVHILSSYILFGAQIKEILVNLKGLLVFCFFVSIKDKEIKKSFLHLGN